LRQGCRKKAERLLGQRYPGIIPILVDEVQGGTEELREVHAEVRVSVARGVYRKHQKEELHTPCTLKRSRLPLLKLFAFAKAPHRFS
jgi:hypothetical protein